MSLKIKLLKVTIPLLTLLTLLISPIFLFNTAYAVGETANANINIENVTFEGVQYVDVSVCLQNPGGAYNAGNMTLAIEFDTNQLGLVGSDKFTQVYTPGIYTGSNGYNQMEVNQPNPTSENPFTLEIKRGANDGGGLAVPNENELIGTVRFQKNNATTNTYGINWFTLAPLSDLYTSNGNQISTTYNDPVVGGKCWDNDNDGVKNSEDTDDSNPCIPNSNSINCVPADTDGDGIPDATENIIGTNPNKIDSDDDSINDNVEIGSNLTLPIDTDGDGIIDALESNTLDTDEDGIVNALDSNNSDPCIPNECITIMYNALINSITLDQNQQNYIVDFSTVEFNNTGAGTHVHFYYEGESNTVVDKMYTGANPYSLPVSTNTNNYTKLCIIVGNPNHSVIDNTGNCVSLPIIQNTSSSSSSSSVANSSSSSIANSSSSSVSSSISSSVSSSAQISTPSSSSSASSQSINSVASSVASSTVSSTTSSSSQNSSVTSSSQAQSNSSSQNSNQSINQSSNQTTSSNPSSQSTSSSSQSSNPTIDDNDGISSEEEDKAPNNGDANNDGIKDSSQPNVVAIKNTRGTYTALEFGQCANPTPSILTFKNESDLNEDQFYNYPFGLAEFEVKCSDTITINSYWYGVDRTKNYIIRKFGKATSTAAQSYFNINASKTFLTIDGQEVLKVSYTLTDNGVGDGNPLTGVILDPVGISEIVTTNTPIAPTSLSTPRTGSPISILYYIFVAVFTVVISKYIIKELRR